ncbi:MAG: glycosyltransferase family protein [Phenylobacterium sp.]|uniref:glycosyltransferase family protein n=1 Tax=Phenylobacterium sp. TaxID=1871053 RepID=UPI0027353DD1|nr:glycosyltransferase family protein [Phenylobacterium sp.]MDP3175318.1 glycosyltransferase family protein [Phenylobacterium sp.]
MILAVLQARMSSTRLPGKVMADVLGVPMIGRQIERLRRARSLDRLVVATSGLSGDDPLAAYCDSLGVSVHRGSLEDVLGRFHGAIQAFGPASTVVRLTADCPLCDWTVVDTVVDAHVAGGFDYTNNTAPERTFPHGLDVEAATPAALEAAWREAVDPYEREHVTPFLYRRPERFRLGSVVSDTPMPQLRWTVDAPQDLDFVRRVYEALYPIDPAFTSAQVAALPVNSSAYAG